MISEGSCGVMMLKIQLCHDKNKILFAIYLLNHAIFHNIITVCTVFFDQINTALVNINTNQLQTFEH